MNKKGDDPNKILENIRRTGSNKQCFDCGEKVIYSSYIGNYICSYQYRNICML